MLTNRTLNLTSRYQVIALAPVALASIWLWRDGAMGILLGGAVMALNFWLLRILATKALGGPQPKLAYGLALVLKFVVVVTVIGLILAFVHPHPLGFVLGMMTLFVGLFFAMIHMALSQPERV